MKLSFRQTLKFCKEQGLLREFVTSTDVGIYYKQLVSWSGPEFQFPNSLKHFEKTPAQAKK